MKCDLLRYLPASTPQSRIPTRNTFSPSRSVSVWMSCVSLAVCMGCTAVGGGSGTTLPTNPEDGNQDVERSNALGLRSGEPNGDFDDALPAIVENNRAELQGTVDDDEDIDVFALGLMSAGDRLIIEAETPNSALDVSIAVYDDEGRIFAENDDFTSANLDSMVDEIVRHDGDPYYLAVGNSAFAEGFESLVGGYFVTVRIDRDGQVPQPAGQLLYLDFDGGTVSDPHVIELNSYDEVIPEFSGASIAPVYANATAEIKAAIIDTLQENFDVFDVTFTSSDEGGPPDGEYSTLMFGGHSTQAFGVSNQVDDYNSDPSDLAVIFTETFTPNMFSETPRPAELGLAIGNVAAHEVGHILGLNHVSDSLDLMDTYAPPDSFLVDQEFQQSPLSDQIMDLGTQDGLLLLAEILGLI